MLDPLIVKAISIGLGLMFGFAAYHKFRDAPGFRITLLEYQLLPQALTGAVSRLLPALELALAAGWLLGLAPRLLLAVTSAALLAVYALAVGINIRRGRVHFDCGCGFGGKTVTEQYLSPGLIVRNFALAAAALLCLLPVSGRELAAADDLILAAALVATALLFGAANQLLRNRAAIDTWRKRR